jgi:hypothetical protein
MAQAVASLRAAIPCEVANVGDEADRVAPEMSEADRK